MAREQVEEQWANDISYYYSSEEDDSSDEEGSSYSPIAGSPLDQHRPFGPSSVVKDFDHHDSMGGRIVYRTSALPSKASRNSLIPDIILPPLSLAGSKSYCPESGVTPAKEDLSMPIFQSESSIETATPILFSTPLTRPSIVLIPAPARKSNVKAARRVASLQRPLSIRAMSERRLSARNITTLPPPKEPLSASSRARQRRGSINPDSRKVTQRRPVAISAMNKPYSPPTAPAYDTSPRRSRLMTSPLIDWPKIRQSQQTCLGPGDTRRLSTVPVKQTSPAVTEPPADLDFDKPASVIRKRRSSIGLALRHASSALIGKSPNSRPPTSSSSGSTESTLGIDIKDFPTSLPSPLLHQSFQFESKSSGTPSRSSKLSRVRATVGL